MGDTKETRVSSIDDALATIAASNAPANKNAPAAINALVMESLRAGSEVDTATSQRSLVAKQEKLRALECLERLHADRASSTAVETASYDALGASIFRGNCRCGRWLIVPPNVTAANPIRCECGRCYHVASDRVVCAPGRFAPALCLDLDGTIRRSKSGVFVSGYEDVEVIPGVEAKIWEYRDRGFVVFGISNQGGVAHGHKTELENDAEIQATVAGFQRNPFHLIKCAYHDAKGKIEPYCHRSLLRKPGYGMLAVCEVEAFGAGIIVDWDASLFVGDRPEDQQCAASACIRFEWAHDFFGWPAPAVKP